MKSADYLGGDEEWCKSDGCLHRAEPGHSQLCPIHLGEIQAAERKRLAEAHERWLRERRTV